MGMNWMPALLGLVPLIALLFEAMALTSKAIRMPKMLKKSMKNRKSLRKRFRNRRSKVGIVGLAN